MVFSPRPSAHMAAIMSAANPFTPVTPPPESVSFPKPPVPRPFPNPLKRKASSQEPLNATSLPLPPRPPMPPPMPPTSSPSGGPPAMSTLESLDSDMTPAAIAGANLDPKYLAMVSRIAAYYQQRCLAVANYQQQRCQAWANVHRQRCQDMMQASMLVVAWYVRDRIQRRRRREKRKFKSGLKRRVSQPKASRTDVVRRWVKQIPDEPESPNSPVAERPMDRSEVDFNMDRDPLHDNKDVKLFEMADNLIKSQYNKIEVPIMGVLNFDESDDESESEADEPDLIEEMDDADEENEEYYDVEDDDLYDDDDDDDDDDIPDDGSELVHRGTGTGSGSRGNELSDSS